MSEFAEYINSPGGLALCASVGILLGFLLVWLAGAFNQ